MKNRFSVIILATLLLYFCHGLISVAYGQSLIFGPEFLPNDYGKSLRTLHSFSVEDDKQNFILSIQGGGNSEENAGRCIVEINGTIAAPCVSYDSI